jgi:hypothetical protein
MIYNIIYNIRKRKQPSVLTIGFKILVFLQTTLGERFLLYTYNLEANNKFYIFRTQTNLEHLLKPKFCIGLEHLNYDH